MSRDEPDYQNNPEQYEKWLLDTFEERNDTMLAVRDALMTVKGMTCEEQINIVAHLWILNIDNKDMHSLSPLQYASHSKTKEVLGEYADQVIEILSQSVKI